MFECWQRCLGLALLDDRGFAPFLSLVVPCVFPFNPFSAPYVLLCPFLSPSVPSCPLSAPLCPFVSLVAPLRPLLSPLYPLLSSLCALCPLPVSFCPLRSSFVPLCLLIIPFWCFCWFSELHSGASTSCYMCRIDSNM